MSIQIAPRVEAQIREKVASGRYATADEVMEEAMRLLDEGDRGDRLRASLIEAEEQTRQGQVVEWTPEVRDQIRRESDAMTRAGAVPDPDVGP
jgi:antitoxin ParD1/3/4